MTRITSDDCAVCRSLCTRTNCAGRDGGGDLATMLFGFRRMKGISQLPSSSLNYIRWLVKLHHSQLPRKPQHSGGSFKPNVTELLSRLFHLLLFL